MSQAFFLDTNIFVYSFDRSHLRKQKRAQSLIAEAIESERSLIVSAAAAARCRILFTDDLPAGRVVRGVEIRNPFI